MIKSSFTIKLKVFWEKYNPIVLGVIGSIIVYKALINGELLVTSFNNILNSTITFSSIIVGFVGVLLAILFSIKNTDTIKLLFKHKAKDRLKLYFLSTIVSGVILVMLSLIVFALNLDQILPIECNDVSKEVIVLLLWGFMFTHMLASGYRIINIVVYIIFSDSVNKNKEPDGIKMDKNKKEELRKRYSSSNTNNSS